METTDQHAAIARTLFDWRATNTPRQPVTGLAVDDLDGAYQVQEKLVEMLRSSGAGERVGYKIALTSAAMQAMVGIDHPLAGVLLAGTMLHSPARVSLGSFKRLGIECEVAVKLGESLPASDAPFNRASVARVVSGCAPAFELVEDGNADYARLDAVSLIADNAWNGANVIGNFVERDASDWLADGFAASRTMLDIDGNRVDAGRVGDALGHPFEAVAWVANLLAKRGHAIERGMVVMTGSSVKTVFPTQAAVVDFEIASLGRVQLELGKL